MPLQRMGRTWQFKASADSDNELEISWDAESVGDDAKRESDKVDLRNSRGQWADMFVFEVVQDSAGTPAAGVTQTYYWAPSRVTTTGAGDANPAKTTGLDAVWNRGEELLDDLWLIGVFKHSNDGTQKSGVLPWTPLPLPVGSLVMHNESGATTTTGESVYLTEIIG